MWHELYENVIFAVLFIVISGIVNVIRRGCGKDVGGSHYLLTLLALSCIWFIYHILNK